VAQSFLMLTTATPRAGMLECLLGAAGVVEFALAVAGLGTEWESPALATALPGSVLLTCARP